jgi:hypothetical protein
MGLTTTEPEIMFQEIMITIRNSVSNFTSSHNEQEVENEDDKDIALGKLSEHNRPGWVVGIRSKHVQQHIDSIWLK